MMQPLPGKDPETTHRHRYAHGSRPGVDLPGGVPRLISPSAATRMTEGLLPPDMIAWMKPELVSPAVAFLASEACDVSGQIIAATAGGYARVQYVVTEGVQFDPAEPVSPEMFAARFGEIADLSTAQPYTGLMGNVERQLRAIGRIR